MTLLYSKQRDCNNSLGLCDTNSWDRGELLYIKYFISRLPSLLGNFRKFKIGGFCVLVELHWKVFFRSVRIYWKSKEKINREQKKGRKPTNIGREKREESK